MPELRKISIKLHEDTYKVIETMAQKSGDNVSETIRKLLVKSLSVEWFKDNQDVMASLIREQMDIAMKPHVERLAKISSKTGHMAAAATFLNVQVLQDIVPAERRKPVKELYDNAMKKAVEYMKTPTEKIKGREDL